MEIIIIYFHKLNNLNFTTLNISIDIYIIIDIKGQKNEE